MEQFAAIDLGSNSFHLVVARAEEHALTVIDRERDMVRLAAGLDEKNLLTPAASARALGCLARFGERLRGLESDNVRVVGTNALRQAKNSRQFIAEAEKALGFSIEIISGVEEARLVYLGAAQTLQGDRGRRLVVDIGGGSTEIIVADRSEPVFLESLSMGCVSTSEKYFAGGEINSLRMRRAILSAQLELEPDIATLRELSAKDVIGTSGTARAINSVLQENGWSETGITPGGLKKLVKKIVKSGHVDNLKINGLSDERRPVFAGGVAVLTAIFNALDLQFMRVSEGSLREGVLHDLIGRVLYEDRRAITVLELMKRHHIDMEHGNRVRQTTLMLFDQVKQKGLLQRERRLLGWAAQLHEIGLMIAHSQHHRHGGYVLENMDLPGFSRQEQGALSIMVRLHRRKYHPELIEDAVYVRSDALGLMTRLLRIAVLFNRGRAPIDLPVIHVHVDDAQVMTLGIPGAWLKDHPLTAADLEQEVELLRAVGYELGISRS
ncbi:MAG: exopolyphosphatase [Gammaproteobacteria bacterium]|nr:exopolyphosphatase [Gammaproteobacteria bacterium]MDH3449420.1 exopolyphosphatase [Gammaproteobacteria bacterium]